MLKKIGLAGLAAMVLLGGCGLFPSAQKAKPSPNKNIAAGPLGGLNVYLCDEVGDRILEVNPAGKVIWTAKVPGPDDIAPTPQGTLIVNSDEHSQVYEVSERTGKIIWTYGQFDHPGAGPGQVNHPEDSFGMPGGKVTITDPYNFRAIQVDKANGAVVWQYGHIGTAGLAPGYLWENNDAVPLKNGDVLLTEAGNPGVFPPTVLEVNRTGKIVWQTTLPQLGYASDAMPMSGGRYVVANWVTGGSIDVFNRSGKILWSYGPASGPGELDHPSSAEPLPNGNFLVSDDYNDRVVVIDPKKNAIVWQYGMTKQPGMGPNHLMGPTDAKAAGELLPPYVQAVGGK